MKRIAIAALVLFGLARMDASAQNAAETIRRAELAFNLAYENNDLEVYFSYYEDGATLWFNTGRVKLDDYKNDWYELQNSGGGVEKATVSDLRVELGPSGDTAIATYVLDVVTRYGDGRRVTEQAWETDIWFLRGGEWKIAHIHYAAREIP